MCADNWQCKDYLREKYPRSSDRLEAAKQFTPPPYISSKIQVHPKNPDFFQYIELNAKCVPISDIETAEISGERFDAGETAARTACLALLPICGAVLIKALGGASQ